jgi:hypothetical protein
MKRVIVILTVAAALVATFWLGTLEQGSKRVNAAELSASQGRYQLTEARFEWTDKNGNSGTPAFAPFLVDTVTGRVWMYNGPNAQVISSPLASAAGIGGFDQVQFNGVFTKDKDGKLVPHASYLPQ